MSTGDNPTGFRPADHPLFSGDVDVPPAPEASSAVLAALLGRAMRVADEGSASLAVVDLAVHAWMEGHLSGEDHCAGCDGRCGFDRGPGRPRAIAEATGSAGAGAVPGLAPPGPVPPFPDPADPVLVAIVLGALAQRPSFLMVGTVEPRKGHAQALAAFMRDFQQRNG